jgi:5-methylcytosine-specific restriction endonuclease McrA
MLQAASRNDEGQTPRSPTEARRTGSMLYWTGNPCQKGHIAFRFTSNRNCVECNSAQSAEWYSAPENATTIKQKFQRYRSQNLDYEKERQAKWRAANPALCKEITKRWRDNNKEHFAEKNREWRQANPEKRRIYLNARRAREANSDGSHTVEDIMAIFKAQRGRCACCRERLDDGYHVDHIEPLALGGSNDKRNLQILCQPCNSKKWMHDPIDFMQSQGFLL